MVLLPIRKTRNGEKGSRTGEKRTEDQSELKGTICKRAGKKGLHNQMVGLIRIATGRGLSSKVDERARAQNGERKCGLRRGKRRGV